MGYIFNYTQSGGSFSWVISNGWIYVTMTSGWDLQYPPNDRIMMAVPENRARIIQVTNGYVVYDQWWSTNGSRSVSGNTNIEIHSTISEPVIRREATAPYVTGLIFDGTVVGSNPPISGVRVQFGTDVTTTGSDGWYLIILTNSGPQSWSVSKDGYYTATGTFDPADTGPSYYDVGLNQITGRPPVQIPSTGSCRASLSWEITGTASHTYTLVFFIGTTPPGGNFQPMRYVWTTATGFQQSRMDYLDMLMGALSGYYDAAIGICENFNPSTLVMSGLYDYISIPKAIEVV